MPACVVTASTHSDGKRIRRTWSRWNSYSALAAPVPRPRLHLICFPGVLAPNARLRSEIIPVEQATEPACDHAQAQAAPAQRVDLFQTI